MGGGLTLEGAMKLPSIGRSDGLGGKQGCRPIYSVLSMSFDPFYKRLSISRKLYPFIPQPGQDQRAKFCHPAYRLRALIGWRQG